MSKVDVTIIMPVYNNEKTLKRALDSVFSQVFSGSIELICAIDPSTDSSLEMLNDYAEKHDNLVVFAPKDRLGAALSRQKAIEMAKGEYICFLDADDRYRHDCIQSFYDTMKKCDADVVNAAFYAVYKNDRKLIYPFRRNRLLKGRKILDSFFMDAVVRGFMWNKMYRKELLLSKPRVLLASFKDMFEDNALNATLLAKCNKVVCISKPLIYYYKNVSSSLSSVKRIDRSQRHLAVFAIQRYFYEKTGNTSALESFKKHIFRMRMSLRFDKRMDKKNGADKEYFEKVNAEWKILTDFKKPLPIKGRSYEELINRAFIE